MSKTVVIPKRDSEITQEITMTDTYTMKLGDRVLNADLAVAKTVTLPPVKEAAGHIYTIFGTDVLAHVLTITQNSEDLIDDNILQTLIRGHSIILNADEEYAVLYSDSVHWHLISYDI